MTPLQALRHSKFSGFLLEREKSIIEVTEVNPAYLDFQFKRIEEEIEEELMNR